MFVFKNEMRGRT